jgi:hypothetical protein
MVATLDRVRVLNYQYGQKPLWVTEVGWSSGPGDRDTVGLTDEDEQARFLVRSMLLLWMGGVERTFWYSFKDDEHNPYGLLEYGRGRTDFRSSLRKPVYYAFRTLNEELEGVEFVDRRDLFDAAMVLGFDDADAWRRPGQPNGDLYIGSHGVARVRYNFSTAGNDYVTFELARPPALTNDTYALGVWVYGDGHEHTVRAWLRDAEGELLQYTLGVVGEPGWTFVSTPVDVPVERGNRVEGSGNLRLDFPATVDAVIVDDAYDGFIGTGTIYLDNLTAIYGREVYDLRFERGSRDLDIIWSPPGVRATLNTRANRGYMVLLDGDTQQIEADDGRFDLSITADPVFLWHRR